MKPATAVWFNEYEQQVDANDLPERVWGEGRKMPGVRGMLIFHCWQWAGCGRVIAREGATQNSLTCGSHLWV